MFKSLLLFFAILSLWSAAAPAQDTNSEKAKTDGSQPAETTQASDSNKAKADDSTPAEKKPGNARKLPAKAPLKATPAPTPEVAETPAPKRGFFSRLFGGHPKATPTPHPTPIATPTPKVHRPRPIRKSAESESSSESTSSGTKADTEKKGDGEKKSDEEKKVEGRKKAETENVGTEKPEPAEKPETEKPEAQKPVVQMPDVEKKGNDGKVDATTPAPLKHPPKGKKHAGSSTAAESSVPVDPETAERNRFDQLKARVVEDPQVQELKAKADSAATEEEGKKALRAYYKALFGKMRRSDPDLKDRIDIMEKVILKRLDE